MCSLLFQVSAQDDYEKNLEAQLEDHASSQQEAMKALDILKPEQKERLMQAISSGDEARIQEVSKEVMKEVTKEATTNPEAIQKLVKYSLKQFGAKDASQLRADILARVEGTPIAPILSTFPKLLDFFVNLLKDPSALPMFFKITANRRRLLIFLGINIALFFVKWFIKRKEKKRKAPFSERMGRFTFFFALRLVLVAVFFHKELWPAMMVAKRTFF